jgi:hypothetical protein
MDVTDVANRIKWYKRTFDIDRVVIDGANKQAVMEIQKRHDVGLTTADKTGKVDFIQIMNAEFIQTKIKLSIECDELKDEYLRLIWDDKSLKRQEHPNCANHLTDAALYAWRFCYQFLAVQEKQKINLRNQDQYIKHTKKLMDDSIQKQADYEQSKEKGDDMWNTTFLEDPEDIASYYINKRR